MKIDGRGYDVCVKLCGSNRVLLLVENFEDVKAPGLLEQAAAAKAGCPGCLEDEEEGLYWPSMYPLRKKGCYIFYPSLPRHGESMFVTMLAHFDETKSQWLLLPARDIIAVSHIVGSRRLCLDAILGGGAAQSPFDLQCICSSAGIYT